MKNKIRNELITYLQDKHGMGIIESYNLLQRIGDNLKKPTKRERFAAMAMQGELAAQSPDFIEYDNSDGDAIDLANRSIKFADALIEQLNQSEGDNETK